MIYVDKNKIILHGTSRGATLAALVLAKTNIFYAGILASGFYDLYEQYKYEEKNRADIFPTKQSIQGKNIEDIPYKQRSPINFVHKISCPVLIVHGSDDLVTPLIFAYKFYEKLRKLRKNVKFIKYKKFAHLRKYSDPLYRSGKIYWAEVLDFLKSIENKS